MGCVTDWPIEPEPQYEIVLPQVNAKNDQGPMCPEHNVCFKIHPPTLFELTNIDRNVASPVYANGLVSKSESKSASII